MISQKQVHRLSMALLLWGAITIGGCAKLPPTANLDPIQTLAISHDVKTSDPSVSNGGEALIAPVLFFLDELMPNEEEKLLSARIAEAPKPLGDVLLEEFTLQIGRSGRFRIVDSKNAQAVATVAITELSVGVPPFEWGDRPVVTVQLTIVDPHGQELWRGRVRVNALDKRTPVQSYNDWLHDPAVAFDAYSAAIRAAVSDLVAHLAVRGRDA